MHRLDGQSANYTHDTNRCACASRTAYYVSPLGFSGQDYMFQLFEVTTASGTPPSFAFGFGELIVKLLAVISDRPNLASSVRHRSV